MKEEEGGTLLYTGLSCGHVIAARCGLGVAAGRTFPPSCICTYFLRGTPILRGGKIGVPRQGRQMPEQHATSSPHEGGNTTNNGRDEFLSEQRERKTLPPPGRRSSFLCEAFVLACLCIVWILCALRSGSSRGKFTLCFTCRSPPPPPTKIRAPLVAVQPFGPLVTGSQGTPPPRPNDCRRPNGVSVYIFLGVWKEPSVRL